MSADHRITIRLTTTELEQLQRLAGERDLGLSTYIRSAALLSSGAPVRRPRRKVQRGDLSELREVLRLLSNLTGNVNQLAYRANSTGRLPVEQSWRAVSAEVGELKEMIRRALGVDWSC